MTATKQVKKTVAKFDKAAIVASDRYAAYRDLLTVTLDENELYSHDDLEKHLNDVLNHEVIKETNGGK